MPVDFLDALLAELRARDYRAEASFGVLLTVTTGRGAFGLRCNPAPRRRLIVSVVSGLTWTPLGERELDEGAEPNDAEFMSWLVGLIEGPALPA